MWEWLSRIKGLQHASKIKAYEAAPDIKITRDSGNQDNQKSLLEGLSNSRFSRRPLKNKSWITLFVEFPRKNYSVKHIYAVLPPRILLMQMCKQPGSCKRMQTVVLRENCQRWLSLYLDHQGASRCMTPPSSDKLSEYKGGGHTAWYPLIMFLHENISNKERGVWGVHPPIKVSCFRKNRIVFVP